MPLSYHVDMCGELSINCVQPVALCECDLYRDDDIAVISLCYSFVRYWC